MANTITALVFIFIPFIAQGSIYKNLKYFETVHADDLTHKIVKRGIQQSDHPYNKIKEIHFNTLGKNFRLILSPKRGVLHPKFKAYSVDGDGKETTVHIDHDDFYDGRVFGEVSSHVNLHMENGVITGSIHLPDEIYHIEPSWRHIPHHDNRTMITYRQSDVEFNWDHGNLSKRHGISEYVGNSEEIEGNRAEHYIDKRQVNRYQYAPTNTLCPLLLVADYRFFQEIGGNNTKTTINYFISLVDRVHKIFYNTFWRDSEKDEGFNGMSFVIKKIIVHTEATNTKNGTEHYNMFRDQWAVRDLLEIFSREYSHKDFCLAHLFTYQKFEEATLGLSYVASPKRTSVGGICTLEYFKNGHILYLNSGLSSSRNYFGRHLLMHEADLATAHQFGYSWGSEHDPETPECSPNVSQGGAYLMNSNAISGYDVNNFHFSPCSLRSINKVLLIKSSRCFSKPEQSFCGNNRVEDGEECDAGLLGTEETDPCCDKNCMLRRPAVCSDKNSLCCQNCQFMKKGVRCKEAQLSTCERESVCTGFDAEYPKSLPMSLGTDCFDGGICRNGKCIPFCKTYELQSCMCDTIENACKRCCMSSINGTCSPLNNQDILIDGTSCMMQGFCYKGHCKKSHQEVVVKKQFDDIVEHPQINKSQLFLRDNIVCVVIVITVLIWIPVTLLVGFVDRKRRIIQLECDNSLKAA